jgi:hypothetical protein
VKAPRTRAGSALLPTLVAVLVLTGLSAMIYRLSLSHSSAVGRSGHELRALYVAEAGLSEALLVVASAVRERADVPAEYGTHAAPVETQAGRFWATIRDNGDETYTVVCTGSASGSSRSIEAVLRHVGGSAFDHAVFAGNTSEDPDYVLRFGGRGTQRDEIEGNVYSAGDILVTGDARIDGEVLATGTITGIAGETKVTRPLPDIAGMEYERNHDVDVAAAFDDGGFWSSNALGGSAYQVPESDPAHIFRKNPDNRLAEVNGTVKDDYFLEDPYMPVRDFIAYNGERGHTITLSGSGGRPGRSGNELLYFVDGNLWVHNTIFLRLRLLTQTAGTRVTFVVKGDIHFCDDVLLDDSRRDGVAFIAIEDAAVPGSGNIYFGDPRFGTLERMQAYMYAEHDFLDNNLAADGSKVVELFGNMTAGNHVSIERDFLKSDGTTAHSKLMVHFDPRLSRGDVTLPGIPRIRAGAAAFQVAFWREVGEQ